MFTKRQHCIKSSNKCNLKAGACLIIFVQFVTNIFVLDLFLLCQCCAGAVSTSPQTGTSIVI